MGTNSQTVEAELAESKENLKQDLKALEQELTHRVRGLTAPRVLEQIIKKYPIESVAVSTIAGLALSSYVLDKKRRGDFEQSFDRLKDVALSAFFEIATTTLAEVLPDLMNAPHKERPLSH